MCLLGESLRLKKSVEHQLTSGKVAKSEEKKLRLVSLSARKASLEAKQRKVNQWNLRFSWNEQARKKTEPTHVCKEVNVKKREDETRTYLKAIENLQLNSVVIVINIISGSI